MLEERERETSELKKSGPGTVSDTTKNASLGHLHNGMSFDDLKGKATEREKQSVGSQLEPVESVATQPTVLQEPSRNLREDVFQAMNLIDSTANDLHSSMKLVIPKEQEDRSRQTGIGVMDIERVKTKVFLGKQINDLMRTKIEAVKVLNEMPEEYVIEEEEEEE